MTLYVRFHNDLTRFSPFDPASLRDKLTDRGWVECERSYTHDRPCDCVEGLVPPEGMVEAAYTSVHKDVHPLSEDPHLWRIVARNALVAAARWERER